MKKLLVLMLPLVCFIRLEAQQITTSSGNNELSGFSADWIIGGSLIDNSILSLGNDKNTLLMETPNIDMIDVYPTLARDFITIKGKDSSGILLNFKIINSQGNQFLKGNFNITTPYDLDVKDLAAGYYIIVFNRPDNPTCLIYKKFVKQ